MSQSSALGRKPSSIRREKFVRVLLRSAKALIIAVSLMAPSLDQVSARDSNLEFKFDAGVTESDQVLIRESIRFSFDFFEHMFSIDLPESLRVEGLNAISKSDPETVARYNGNEIEVFVGSEGWTTTSEDYKLHSIAHEVTHHFEFTLSKKGFSQSLVWIDEGVAEYLSTKALSDAGILDWSEFTYFESELLSAFPPGVPLQELENVSALQKIGADAYPSAYIAVSYLMRTNEIGAIADYYSSLGDGLSATASFENAFGLSLSEFYAKFQWPNLPNGRPIPPGDIFTDSNSDFESPLLEIYWPYNLQENTQAIFRAVSNTGSTCRLDLMSPYAPNFVSRLTAADGNGEVFWLFTVPSTWQSGLVRATMECGEEPVSKVLTIN